MIMSEVLKQYQLRSRSIQHVRKEAEMKFVYLLAVVVFVAAVGSFASPVPQKAILKADAVKPVAAAAKPAAAAAAKPAAVAAKPALVKAKALKKGGGGKKGPKALKRKLQRGKGGKKVRKVRKNRPAKSVKKSPAKKQ